MNRFRVFSTANQNDFGIVSLSRRLNEICSRSCEKLRDVINIKDDTLRTVALVLLQGLSPPRKAGFIFSPINIPL